MVIQDLEQERLVVLVLHQELEVQMFKEPLAEVEL
jgi:hypothetical protein